MYQFVYRLEGRDGDVDDDGDDGDDDDDDDGDDDDDSDDVYLDDPDYDVVHDATDPDTLSSEGFLYGATPGARAARQDRPKDMLI